MALLGDIYAHMGNAEPARKIFQDEIVRNPDNDQAYLSLALLDLRGGDIAEARRGSVEGAGTHSGLGQALLGAGVYRGDAGKFRMTPRQISNAPSICCPSGREVIRLLAFFTLKRDRSLRPEMC